MMQRGEPEEHSSAAFCRGCDRMLTMQEGNQAVGILLIRRTKSKTTLHIGQADAESIFGREPVTYGVFASD